MATIDPTDPSLDAPEACHADDGDTLSEDALARRFTERLAQDARYVRAWRRWLLFGGTAWQPDETLRVLSEARAICRAATYRAHPAVTTRIRSAATVAAVERLARLDRRHEATPAQWDADPWLLNTPGGTVDLRDGTLRPHRREDYITATTSVAPGGECRHFLAVLARLFAGDAALVGFVQRALGSALAGPVHLAAAEPALFLACGPAGSGKSVLLDTVVAVLGGYAAAAPLEALGVTARKRHDDTRLARARLVVATEATERSGTRAPSRRSPAAPRAPARRATGRGRRASSSSSSAAMRPACARSTRACGVASRSSRSARPFPRRRPIATCRTSCGRSGPASSPG